MQTSAILLFIILNSHFISISFTFSIRNIQRYEQNLDDLLRSLYGDFEPESELFLEPRFANHGGDESALHYTNEWLVYVPNGEEKANQLANDTGYLNMGQVLQPPPPPKSNF